MRPPSLCKAVKAEGRTASAVGWLQDNFDVYHTHPIFDEKILIIIIRGEGSCKAHTGVDFDGNASEIFSFL